MTYIRGFTVINFFLSGPNPRRSKDTLVDVEESSQIKQGQWSYRVLEDNNNKVYRMGIFVYKRFTCMPVKKNDQLSNCLPCLARSCRSAWKISYPRNAFRIVCNYGIWKENTSIFLISSVVADCPASLRVGHLGLLYKQGLTLIIPWISNHMHIPNLRVSDDNISLHPRRCYRG